MGIKIQDLFTEPRKARKPEPHIVRNAEEQIRSLRGRLTRRDRERNVTVVLASLENPAAAIARSLALAVEGELVQIALKQEGR